MFCAMKSTSRLGTAKNKVKNKMFNRNLESKSKIIAIRKNETIPLTIIDDSKSVALESEFHCSYLGTVIELRD